MPVTRRLMKPGTFSLKLQPNTPYKIHSAVSRFDVLVITPTRLMPIEGFSNANILSSAIYAGVITRTPSPTDISGHGLEWYLGSPKGYGAGTAGTQGLLTTPVSQTAATLSTWVAALCPPALTVGTVTNGALPTLTDAYQFVTRREALDAVVRQVGAEYRINPTGTIDAAAPDTLFGATPDVVITRKPEGRDGGYWGLEGSTIAKSTDTDEYISRAIVVTRGEGSAATATTVAGTTAFRDFAGNSMHVERYIDAPTGLAANATLIGNAAIAKFNGERRDLRLSSRTYVIDRFATPGDNIFVFDPVAGLVDQANQIVFRGEVMSPLKLRVFGLTYPIEGTMGVYVRRATGPGSYTYTDLSDWVIPEDGEVQWEVGAPRRPVLGTDAARNEGTVATLGVNPDVAARATVIRTPGARARRSGGINLVHNTNTAVLWDTEDYDTDAFHDSTTNTSRLTIPAGRAGTYVVGYTVNCLAGGGVIAAWVSVNGDFATRFGENQHDNSAANGTCLTGSDFLVLNAGDYVECVMYQNSGGTLLTNNLPAIVSFWLTRIGD
jgi:hypothetical protein